MLFPNTKFIRTFKDPIDCDRFYFGYGSNVNNKIMSKRCPGAIPLGIGAITNMKFTINKLGVATLLPKSNFMSYGILWIINEKHERRSMTMTAADYNRTIGKEKPVIAFTKLNIFVGKNISESKFEKTEN